MRDAQLARNTPCQQSWRGHGSERIPSSLSRVRTRWQVTENSGAKDKLKSMNLSLAVFEEVVFHCYHVSNDRAPSETKPISNDESSAWNVFLILTIMQDAMTQRLISNMSMSFESNIRNYQCLGRNMLLPCLSFRNPGIGI